jgi:hypothetical protein
MAKSLVVNNAEEIPFSSILASLLQENLDAKPHKKKVFNNLFGVVAIEITDLEQTLYLNFSGGQLVLEKSIENKPHITVKAESEKIMGLNFISIKFGLPYYFDEAGRTVIKQLLTGEIKIQGMFLHLNMLTKLTKVLSVV